MKGFKQINEKEFKQIKGLREAGVTIPMINKLTKRSWFTISFIDKTNSLSDYRNATRAYMKKHSLKQEVKPVYTVSDTSIDGQFKQLNTKMDVIIRDLLEIQNAVVGIRKWKIF